MNGPTLRPAAQVATPEAGRLGVRAAMVVFLVFAFAYFFSALVRAITATLAPTLTLELNLSPSDLGLLAGAYFLGFSATQLPLGTWLDRYGPRRVLIVFLTLAVIGCLAFAAATSFWGLIVARVAIGIGVSACLMAPLTGFRTWLSPSAQLRANSWMLMTGSFGMLASTLPVQWLVPLTGWRFLFVMLAVLFVLSIAAIWWRVPELPDNASTLTPEGDPSARDAGYRAVFAHPYFRRMALLGFCHYGGFISIQTLWAGPWLVRVAGWSADAAAAGLFFINLSMLATFFSWGILMPRLTARGYTPVSLIRMGVPVSLASLLLCIVLGPQATAWTWALFCVTSTFVSLAQPSVGMAFPSALAGRALSAYNLLIFSGVFVVQWGIGLAIDLFQALGWSEVAAFRGAFTLFGLGCLTAYIVFLSSRADVGAWSAGDAGRTGA